MKVLTEEGFAALFPNEDVAAQTRRWIEGIRAEGVVAERARIRAELETWVRKNARYRRDVQAGWSGSVVEDRAVLLAIERACPAVEEED